MGQQEIFDILTENKGKKYTTRQLAKELNVSEASVARDIRKLKRGNFLCSKKYKIKLHNIVFVWVD